jgi:hypothetical protein
MKPFALWSLLFLAAFPPFLAAQSSDAPMTADELACLQKMIFFHECSGKTELMTTWNSDEDFPSFGIGHFIWYPTGKKGPYKETFPEYLAFMEEQKEEIPDWVKKLPVREAPWQDREEFLDDLSGERMILLREFLDRTQKFQAQFILRRTEGVLPKILATLPEEKQPEIETKFKMVADTPNGMFALIDYVNFKGEGILETERFQGQGWGLLQVLETMQIPEEKEGAVKEFVQAAKKVLEDRCRNAPPERDCSKRLKGWKARVKNYLKIHC